MNKIKLVGKIKRRWNLVLALCLPLMTAACLRAVESEPTETPIANSSQETEGPFKLALTAFATGFDQPVGIYHAGDNRLFVIERRGVISIVEPDSRVLSTPFLDVTDRVDTLPGEEGLLGLAFHPQYATTGYFYLNYINTSGGIRRTRISRFQVTADPNLADSTSEMILLTIDQPEGGHNGGDIHFGPDGYLYIPMADGGPNNSGNAQMMDTVLGKLLRIDVNAGPGSPPDCVGQGSGGYTNPESNPFVDGDGSSCDEIWASGLRNPWRSSFDRQTGDLYIADVGDWRQEEINFQPAGSGGGQNYGWPCFEGSVDTSLSGCGPKSNYIFPIFEYGHNGPDCSVTGGYVYRGSRLPALTGHYFFTDFCSGNFWELSFDDQDWQATKHTNLAAPGYVTFGEDANGELYVANFNDDTVYRLE